MKSILSFVGLGPSQKQINAENQAQQAQQREAFASQEQAQRLAAETAASGRIMATAGRQQLAFQGNTSGQLATTLGG